MDSQPTLFGSVPSVAGALFSEDDRYRLFARKVWPVLGTEMGSWGQNEWAEWGQNGVASKGRVAQRRSLGGIRL